MTKVWYVVIIILFAVCGFFIWKTNENLNKIVVVDVIRAFNDFKMKKEMEVKVAVELEDYSNRLDSLNAMLEMAIDRNDKSRRDIVEHNIYNIQEQAKRAYEISNKNINEQVWKRLNPLVDEYAKKHKYRLVIGANGMGTVLYNEATLDVTDDFIKFINTRYETGN